MKVKTLSTSLLGALLLGSVANGQTMFDDTIAGVALVGSTYEVTGDVTIAADSEYVFENPTYVTKGGSLTIEEGAILRFQPAAAGTSAAFLVVSADGTVDAQGSSSNPVIMTTAAAPDKSRWVSGAFWDSDPKNNPQVIDSADDINLWGGFILLGSAPINTGAVDIDDDGLSAPGYAKIEGVGAENGARVYYGGINVNDNSGVVRYVSIRYSGSVLGEGDEIQGLTLGGVGRGTTLEFIEVYGSGDDGIEVFGGNAAFKYLVLSFFDDDGFDLDQGYTGMAQFGLVVASNFAGLATDNLYEMDGDDDISDDEFNISDDGRPLTYAVISNFTLIGHETQTGRGMRLRQGFGGEIVNTIVANVPGNGLRIDDSGTLNAAAAGYPSASSADRVAAGTLNLVSVSWHGTGGGSGAVDTAVITNDSLNAPGAANNIADTLASASFGNGGAFGDVLGTAPFNPLPFSGATTSVLRNPGATFFDTVNFRGAFPIAPSATLWTTGWTALNTTGYLVDNGINN